MAPETLHIAKSIILDVEGTTTSISFVKETLFPYVRDHLAEYVEKNWGKESLASDLKLLKEQCDRDKIEKVEGLVEIEEGENERTSLIKNIEWQMDNDRKATALKELQGHIWEQGYKSGDLKGHIYDDVPECLKRWVDDGRRLFVYSSGSIEAQKLLFGNTIKGDLLDRFSGFFDTTTGPKMESKSYSNIAASIDCPADQILFLTDVVKEAEAAKTAGLQAVIVVREGNAPLTEEDQQTYTVIKSFEDLVLERCAKRARVEETVTEEKTAVATEEAKKPEEEPMEVDVSTTETDTEKTENTEPSSTTEQVVEAEKMKVDDEKVDETPTTTSLEGKLESCDKVEDVPSKENDVTSTDEKIVTSENEEISKENVSKDSEGAKVESSDEVKVSKADDVIEEVMESSSDVGAEITEEVQTKVEEVAEGKIEKDSAAVADSSNEVKVNGAEQVSESSSEVVVDGAVSDNKEAKETEVEEKAAPVEEVKEDKEVESKEETEKIESEVEEVKESKVEATQNGSNGESQKEEELKTNGKDVEPIVNESVKGAEAVKGVKVVNGGEAEAGKC